MIKFLSVVGARPNFMKIAPVVEELRRFPVVQHCLVHSGQHYDELLSGNFFSELSLPQPDVNLQVGSGSHAVQTAEIMKRLEPVLLQYQPDMVVVVGDVNSTIATALTASKLGIPVAHIEAGLRSFDMSMPEEINRKLTDAISDLLFASEESGVTNLRNEGVPADRIYLVGNVMIDSLVRHRAVAARSTVLDRLAVGRNGSGRLPYGVLTLHRPSNVDDPSTLEGILAAVSAACQDLPVFFPVHPRTRKNIERFGLTKYFRPDARAKGIVPIEPLGYVDFLCLTSNAGMVLTDSGGIQEETSVLGIPCLTLRENTERPVTVQYGTNEIVGIEPNRITAAVLRVLNGEFRRAQHLPLWDGKAAARIVDILVNKVQQEAPACRAQGARMSN